MIYAAIMDKGKFVKIGYTRSQNVEKRLAQLQTGSPFYIKLEFSIEGTLMQEQAIHASLRSAFNRIRIKIPGNEWYPAKHPFMREFLKLLKGGGPNAAIAFSERYNPAVKQWGKSERFNEKNRLRDLGF